MRKASFNFFGLLPLRSNHVTNFLGCFRGSGPMDFGLGAASGEPPNLFKEGDEGARNSLDSLGKRVCKFGQTVARRMRDGDGVHW